MRENRIRKSIQSNFVAIKHIDGKTNLADIFTKEMKDISHFVLLRDLIMCPWLIVTWHLVYFLTIFIFEGGIGIFKYSASLSFFSLDSNLL